MRPMSFVQRLGALPFPTRFSKRSSGTGAEKRRSVMGGRRSLDGAWKCARHREGGPPAADVEVGAALEVLTGRKGSALASCHHWPCPGVVFFPERR
jgi:hypothetical protein